MEINQTKEVNSSVSTNILKHMMYLALKFNHIVQSLNNSVINLLNLNLMQLMIKMIYNSLNGKVKKYTHCQEKNI
jgi:hypothetical protein